MTELERGLLAVIAARSGRSGLAFARRPESLTGGYWARISAFSLIEPPRGFAGELILRCLPSSPRTRIEIAVQTAVAELGFPTPRVRASGGADEALGCAFLIMDRAEGATFSEELPGVSRLRRMHEVPRRLADAQLQLHSLPVEPLVERLRKHGLTPLDLSLSALLDQLSAQIRALRSRQLSDALDWLTHTRPSERERVLCHCDVHPNNLIVAPKAPARSTAQDWTLIDWTNARLAEPELDVAFSAELLELAPVGTPRALRAVVRFVMRRASLDFQRSYGARAPLDPGRVTWYQALYRLQLLVRVEAARAALPDAPPLPSAHPWRGVAPFAAARLRAAMAA